MAATATSTPTRVGDAFLSAAIQTMINKLTSTEYLDYANNQKLNLYLLTQLQTILLAIAHALEDAEKKQFANHNVRQWLDGLKDAIHDADDLLDHISYYSMRRNVTNQVQNFLSSLFNTNRDIINSEIKELGERLQLFAQQIEILDLQAISREVFRIARTHSIVNDEHFLEVVAGKVIESI